jgi:hypothetical protein
MARRKQNYRKGKSNQKSNTTRKRYEVTQTRKIISAYGGVGSIIETPDGAILVEPFNEWNFFKNDELWNNPANHIEDKRFLRRLRTWFEKLELLVKVPANDMNRAYPQIKDATVAASYFPKWMYCSKCNRFDHLDNWLKHWKNTAKDNNYHPPKCYHCYNNAVNNQKKKYYNLEQIRFILTSPNGNIADIPWDRWVFAQNRKKEEEEEENDEKKPSLTLDFDKDIRDDIYFEYTTSDKFNNLTGISIIAKDIATGKKVKSATLAGVFGLRVPEFGVLKHGKAMMKVVIRSSNSVYYPNVLQSLKLPNEGNQVNTEEDYRFAEFQFITAQNDYSTDDLSIERIDENFFEINGIKNIYRLDTLKMTSVQVSYTRQEPIDKDYYLQDDLELRNTQGQIVKKRYTSKYGAKTTKLPAIENMGEGIFFEFDIDLIETWINDNKNNLQARADAIQKNYDNTKLSDFEQRNVTPKYLLIHTFSHLIIKELEFLSGYPATSLKERLYIGDTMHGILIYTIAGAEGSYGGLVSLCDDSKIDAIIHSALERAKDCAADPICEHTDLNGQGVGGTNLAACYSCALLPETSCEEFNRFLDRKELVDNDFGFFNNF